MSQSILVFVLVCVAWCGIFSLIQAQTNSTTIVPNPIYCRRFLSSIPAPRTFTLTGIAGCATQGKAIAGALQFALSVNTLPFKAMHVFKFANSTAVSAADFKVYFGIDGAIWYTDVDGVPGFNPLNDTYTSEFALRDTVNPLVQNVWSDLTYSKVDLGGDNQTDFYTITSQLEKPPAGFCGGGSYGVQVAPREVYIRQNGTTMAQRSILTPNSFKTTFSLTDLQPPQPSGAKIAIGAFLITKRNIRRRNSTDVPQGTIPRPNQVAPGENEVFELESEDAASQRIGGSFSWKPYIVKWDSIAQNRSSVPIVATLQGIITDPQITQYVPQGYVMRRIWFALDPMNPVPPTNFEWDPNLSAEEDTTSPGATPSGATPPKPASAATSLFSMISLIVIALVMLL